MSKQSIVIRYYKSVGRQEVYSVLLKENAAVHASFHPEIMSAYKNKSKIANLVKGTKYFSYMVASYNIGKYENMVWYEICLQKKLRKMAPDLKLI